jgi:hypothetical protein
MIAQLPKDVASLTLDNVNSLSIENWLRYQEDREEPSKPMTDHELGNLLIFLQAYDCEHAYKSYLKLFTDRINGGKCNPLVAFPTAALLKEDSLCVRIILNYHGHKYADGENKGRCALDPHYWSLTTATETPFKYYVALVQACQGRHMTVDNADLWKRIATCFEAILKKPK